MSYLVDTNIYSEPVKPKPEPNVIEWLRTHERELYVSTAPSVRFAEASSVCPKANARPSSARGCKPSATA